MMQTLTDLKAEVSPVVQDGHKMLHNLDGGVQPTDFLQGDYEVF